jgi:hypothetical protein
MIRICLRRRFFDGAVAHRRRRRLQLLPDRDQGGVDGGRAGPGGRVGRPARLDAERLACSASRADAHAGARAGEVVQRLRLSFVELKAGASVTAEELIAHCKTLLAGYKVPKEIRFEPIPKTSTGKIQKFQLRERAKSASAIE